MFTGSMITVDVRIIDMQYSSLCHLTLEFIIVLDMLIIASGFIQSDITTKSDFRIKGKRSHLGPLTNFPTLPRF